MPPELSGSRRSPSRAPIVRVAGLAARDRMVVLQHGGEALSAQLLDVLVERGIEPLVRGVCGAGDLPDPGSVRAAIVVGSGRPDEAAAAGYLQAEVEWLRRADRAGAAVLGLGHGARVLTLAFGGRLRPADRPIRGRVMVETSIPHLIAAGPWLTWQHDVIALPCDAQVLARNRLGPQAFRVGRHLGVHFHPEATPGMLVQWAARSREPVDARALLDATARDANAATVRTRRLLSTFLTTL